MERQTGYIVRANQQGPVTFIASAPDVARDGMSIVTDAWDVTNYLANPILLYGHDYSGLPIGRTKRLEKTPRGLVADVEFDQEDPNARMIENKIRRGFLNAVSVGFEVRKMEGNVVTEAELLEISVVPVPADAKALAIARSAYQSALGGRTSDDEALEALQIINMCLQVRQVEQAVANIPTVVRREARAMLAGRAA